MVSTVRDIHQAKGEWYAVIEFANAFLSNLGKEPTTVCLQV